MNRVFVEAVVSRRRNRCQIAQLDLLLFVTCLEGNAAGEGTSLALLLCLLLLGAIVRVVLSHDAQVGDLRSRAIDTTVFLCGADLGEVAWGQTTDYLLSVAVEEVALSCTSDRALHVMVFSRGNSDTRHRGDDSVLLDGLADGALELVEVHAASLLHDLAHTRLALLEGLQSVVFGRELFAPAADTAASEVNFAHGKLASWVLRGVNLLQHLQVAELGSAHLLRMRQLAVLAGARAHFQVAEALRVVIQV